MSTRQIEVSVTEGMFSSEKVATVNLKGGIEYSFFVSAEKINKVASRYYIDVAESTDTATGSQMVELPTDESGASSVLVYI